MAQVFQTATRNVNGTQSALAKQMFYARKRRRQRAEATADKGGLRRQVATFGVRMRVQLTLQ